MDVSLVLVKNLTVSSIVVSEVSYKQLPVVLSHSTTSSEPELADRVRQQMNDNSTGHMP
jgi:hypothetical protein